MHTCWTAQHTSELRQRLGYDWMSGRQVWAALGTGPGISSIAFHPCFHFIFFYPCLSFALHFDPLYTHVQALEHVGEGARREGESVAVASSRWMVGGG